MQRPLVQGRLHPFIESIFLMTDIWPLEPLLDISSHHEGVLLRLRVH